MFDLTTMRRPRRILARTLGFGFSTLLGAALLTWAPAAASGWNQGAAEATLWQLLNGARANNGMAPLQSHGTLVGLARWRSADMLAKDYFSHTIAGCGCLVYAYYDSNGLNYVWGGENIGWNSGLDDSYSPVRVHEQFMGSAGHRANVLNPAFTHGGVGAAAADNQMFQGYVQNTRMFTELFLQAPSAPAPAPAPAPRQPAPAPRPSTGTTTTARASAPAPKAEPKPKAVSVAAPQRPVSTAGIDGVSSLVAPPDAARMLARIRAEEANAARVAAAAPAETATTVVADGAMEINAAPQEQPGPFDGIVAAVLGFLFG